MKLTVRSDQPGFGCDGLARQLGAHGGDRPRRCGRPRPPRRRTPRRRRGGSPAWARAPRRRGPAGPSPANRSTRRAGPARRARPAPASSRPPQRPHRRTAEGEAAPRQAAPSPPWSAAGTCGAGPHRLAVAAVDVEHVALAVGPGDPQQSGQLPVGLEQERVRRRAHRQGARRPGSAGPAGRLGVGPAHRQHVAGRAERAGPLRAAPPSPPRAPQRVRADGPAPRGPHAPRRGHGHQQRPRLVRALLVLALRGRCRPRSPPRPARWPARRASPPWSGWRWRCRRCPRSRCSPRRRRRRHAWSARARR